MVENVSMSLSEGICHWVCSIDQRNLGMSMKVERSTVDQIKQRFEFNKKKKEEEKKKYGTIVLSYYWCQ